MLLMTNERCPDCGQIIYIRLLPKDMANDLIIADGCYLTRDGEFTIAMFDDKTVLPDYCCIMCGWLS